MTDEIQMTYRIETYCVDRYNYTATLGYATGAPEDITKFYQATGLKVNVEPIKILHITKHDAEERVRLEDMLNGAAPVPPTGPTPRADSTKR